MKKYLNKEQTNALINMGFEKPTKKILNDVLYGEIQEYVYSIGELIEILPKRINGFDGILNLYQCILIYNESANNIQEANVRDEFYLRSAHHELIDTLYQTIVKLKELEVYDKR